MKKIKAIYTGHIDVFVPGQGIIKKGDQVLVNERDLERKDIEEIKKEKKEVKK